PVVRVAAVHAASVFLDRDGSIDKACRLIEEAAAEGAKLIAFPEAFVPGYPYWIWTHTPATGAPLFFDFYSNAITIPSDAVDRLGAAAKRAGAYVVIGVTEREGGTLYNTMLFFDDQGRLTNRHRKLQPTHVERTVWGRGDGSDLFVQETPFGRVGSLARHLGAVARPAVGHLQRCRRGGGAAPCPGRPDLRHQRAVPHRRGHHRTAGPDRQAGDDPRGGRLVGHHRAQRPDHRRPQHRRRGHTLCGSRPEPDRVHQVRLRFRRPLCPAGRAAALAQCLAAAG